MGVAALSRAFLSHLTIKSATTKKEKERGGTPTPKQLEAEPIIFLTGRTATTDSKATRWAEPTDTCPNRKWQEVSQV